MIDIKDYRAHPAVNVSTLKQLDNPRWIKWRMENPDAEDEEKTHFRVGGAIDTLLTNKGQFNDLYMIGTLNRPGGLMTIFIDNLPLDLTENSPQSAYDEAYEASGYVIPKSLAIKRLWETQRNREYYISRKQAHGKSIISAEEYDQVTYCASQILNNAFTRQYFQSNDPSIRLVHQAVVLFDWNDTKCKGALDGLMINYDEKKIYPFDLKTTARRVTNFASTFLMHGYYLQGAFYVEGLKKVLRDNPEQFLNFYNLPMEVADYEIDNMRFIVTEKRPNHIGLPAFIFYTTPETHELGIHGGKIDGRKYKGFVELLDAWKFHNLNNYWEYSKEYLDNKGEFEISFNGLQ